MGILDNFINRLVDNFSARISDAYLQRGKEISRARAYYFGDQRKMMRKRANGPDYNITVNFIKPIVNKSVSLLFGKPVKFEYPEGATAQQEYIEQVYESNKQGIMLHNLARYGSEAGHVFLKYQPQAEGLPRLIPLDPEITEAIPHPDDKDMVIEYRITYKSIGLDGKEVNKMEITRMGYYETQLTRDGVYEIVDSAAEEPVQNWKVQNYEASHLTGGKWQLVSEELWDYPDPPIIDWQNYPNPSEHYGIPDVTDDEIQLQNVINYTVSNQNKIIASHGHPFTWGNMVGVEKKQEMGPDIWPSYENPDAKWNQLPPIGDMPGIDLFLNWLKGALFEITQTVDMATLHDKVGTLTNFGLHVLFQDALSKLDTKRELYGWGLRELNRRILVFGNLEPVECKVIWEDPLPKNENEISAMYQADLNMGIVDKQTVAERRGYDWDTVKERLDEEQQSQENIGSVLLNAFNRNGGGGAAAR